MQPVGGPVCLDDEHARHWFELMIAPGRPTDYYCLIFNEEERPVGEVSFHRMNTETMVAEFNIKITNPERGKGYAREAMLVFLDDFFNRIGGSALIDDVALDNHAGQQALLHFGFKHDPGVKDAFRLVMTRERFLELYSQEENQ